MDNAASYCNYECTRCLNVCPTEALIRLSPEEKKRDQTGVATFIQDNCVVFTQKTECGACAEHCPTKAVRMVYDEEKRLRVPKIEEKICIGCGACEYACPTRPYRAIYVKAHSEHKLADLPKTEPLTPQKQAESTSDFPF